MEISLENLFVDQGHRLLELRAGGGWSGSFLAEMKYPFALSPRALE